MSVKLFGESRAGWLAIFTPGVQLPILGCLCLKGSSFLDFRLTIATDQLQAKAANRVIQDYK